VVRAVTNAGTQAGRVRFRIIKADANAANATEITSGQQLASIVTLAATGTDYDSTLTVNPGAFTISNQYLFIQIAWERTAAGGMTSADVNWQRGSSSSVGTRIVSSDFTVAGADLSRDIPAENLAIADVVAVTETPLEAAPSDAVEVIETVTAAFETADLAAPLLTDALKITETITAALTPELALPATEAIEITDTITAAFETGDLAAALTESLVLDDIGQGRTQLLGVLKIADIVTAAIETGDLAAPLLTDALKIAEIVTPALTPELALPVNEAIKLSDVVSVTENPLQASPSEALKIAESLSVVENPLQAGPTEAIKIADAVTVLENPLQAGPTEAIKLADIVTISGDLAAILTESLKIAESLAATETPLEAGLTEAIKLADTVTVAGTLVASLLESLKISETVNASEDPLQAAAQDALKVSETLSVALALSATLTDSLKISETLAALESPLQASPTESLKLADTPTVTIGANLATTLSETFKIDDIGQGRTELLGVLKISDQITAVMGAPGALNVVATETIKIALDPQSAAELTSTESLEITETVTAAVSVAGLTATLTESLKIGDAVTAGPLGLTATAGPENLKLADQVSVFLGVGLATSIAESLKISDTPTALRLPLTAAPTEAIRLSDFVTANIQELGNLARLVTAELLRLGDQVFLTPVVPPTGPIIALKGKHEPVIALIAKVPPGQLPIIAKVGRVKAPLALLGLYDTSIEKNGSYTTTIELQGVFDG
jgi:hypothetical protein